MPLKSWIQKSDLRRFYLLLLLLLLLPVLAFGWLLREQGRSGYEQDNAIITNYEMLRQGRLLMMHAVNMETGVRGYLLSGNKKFLEPYDYALDRIDASYALIDGMMGQDDETLRQVLVRIRRELDDIKTIMAEQIKRYEKTKGSQFSLTLNDLWQSKEAMDKLRATMSEFFQRSNLELNAELAEGRRIQSQYLWFAIGGSLALLGALMLSSLLLMHIRQRAQTSETVLRHFEEGYKLLLENMNDGMFDYHPTTGYYFFSPSHERLLGYKSSELPNRVETFNNLLHPDDFNRTWDTINRYIRREIDVWTQTFRLLNKSGEWRWVLSRGVGIWDDEGHIRRLIGIHTDITEQKNREEELQQLNDELESFAYIASHDLRGPLINIKGFAGEVAYALDQISPKIDRMMPCLPADQQGEVKNILLTDVPEALGFIHSAVDKMDKLTSAILDLSRIGRRDYRIEEVDSEQVVKDCLGSLAYEIAKKNIVVEYHNLPKLKTDEVALEQIFGNILDNAVKYSGNNGGRIVVNAEMAPGSYVFSVKDTGSGIAELDKKKIFDIFRRGSNARDTRGVGMGMAYVKATLRKLGGKVWFESEVGLGTTFYFTLPYDALRELT